MSAQTAQKSQPQLDLSDVEHRVGKLVGGGQLWEPCTAMDIRRWVMAMDYPNPIHWDQELARNSQFGGIVAPQSFAVGRHGLWTWRAARLCWPDSRLTPDLRWRRMVVLRPSHPAARQAVSGSPAPPLQRYRHHV